MSRKTPVSRKTYRVREVARLARVTVRTLHHYDEIGLLVPSGRTPAGYRQYSEDDLLRLQEILLCREFGMPLEQIGRTLEDPRFDRREALLQHRERLVERARRTTAMLRSVDVALAALEGGAEMRPAEMFDGFDPATHAEEADRRWGATAAYAEAARRTRGYSSQDWARIRGENAELLDALAGKLRAGAPPDHEAVVDLAERHRRHIDRWYYPCDHPMHVALASLYMADERFAASFEQHGEGLARFLAAAIQANAARH